MTQMTDFQRNMRRAVATNAITDLSMISFPTRVSNIVKNVWLRGREDNNVFLKKKADCKNLN